MSLALHKASQFETDVVFQFEWYHAKAGEAVAWRFFDAVDSTLLGLTRQPGLGKATRFRHPELHGLRSFRVHAPFDAHLIFYRTTEHMLSVERLMHGARDLPRRLREPPGSI